MIYYLVNKQVIVPELSLSFHVLNVKTDHWLGMCALCVHHKGLDKQCLSSDSWLVIIRSVAQASLGSLSEPYK